MKKNVLALSIAAMIGGLGFVGSAAANVVGQDTSTVPVPVGAKVAEVTKEMVQAGQMFRSNIGVPVTAAAGSSRAFGGGMKFFDVNEGGVGHILLVPYYTAQDNNNTIVHLVNTDPNNGKVAKVRFRAAANSDDVLDFQILLSPNDVWTGFVGRGADGIATLTTFDNTCSIPAIPRGTAVPFVTDRLDHVLSADARAQNTREGYVEIFNSADIPAAKVFNAPAFNTNSALYTATKHVDGTAPCTQGVIEAALFNENFVDGNIAKAVNMGLAAPTGGLMADWYILNVPNTTTYSGGATALVALTNGNAPAVGNFLAFPQNSNIKFNRDTVRPPELYTADPTLVSPGAAFSKKDDTGNVTIGTGVPGDRDFDATRTPFAFADKPVIEAIASDFPDLSTPYSYTFVGALRTAQAPLNQAASLTQALAVNSVTNQYATDASISAATDWVFSMPTRRYSVALDYNKRNAAGQPARVYSSIAGTQLKNGKNIEFFHDRNTEVINGQICVNTTSSVFFDREERARAGTPLFSPSRAPSTRLCGEASVMSFGQGGTQSRVLGASVAREDVNAAAIFENGWGRVSTPNGGVGLPLLGFGVQRLSNPQVAAGVSGNFGITWPHRFVKTNR